MNARYIDQLGITIAIDVVDGSSGLGISIRISIRR
jgi:hypothetical protein